MYGVNLSTLLTKEESMGEYYLPFNPDSLGTVVSEDLGQKLKLK